VKHTLKETLQTAVHAGYVPHRFSAAGAWGIFDPRIRGLRTTGHLIGAIVYDTSGKTLDNGRAEMTWVLQVYTPTQHIDPITKDQIEHDWKTRTGLPVW
jgi:hypothetical protein